MPNLTINVHVSDDVAAALTAWAAKQVSDDGSPRFGTMQAALKHLLRYAVREVVLQECPTAEIVAARQALARAQAELRRAGEAGLA